ncbi:MAG: hypothetical protein AAF593_14130 [Planctomycetota bacterium]
MESKMKKLIARPNFWGDEVGCFCHEAVGRLLESTFDGVVIHPLDIAYEKYQKVADQPKLQPSAWAEFLRSGPRYTFTLATGEQGWFSRYEVGVEVMPQTTPPALKDIQSFINGLVLGEIQITEKD